MCAIWAIFPTSYEGPEMKLFFFIVKWAWASRLETEDEDIGNRYLQRSFPHVNQLALSPLTFLHLFSGGDVPV